MKGDVPLYSIGREALPPKTAILIWNRSNIAVVNKAQVDAQLPLPTGIISPKDCIDKSKAHTDYYIAARPNSG